MVAARVVVVGGGASGALAATQLVRAGGAGLEVTVLEPRPEIGLGAAFSTRDPWHRLNVPAITMSALPDDVDDFRRWAGASPEVFLDRMTWGRYVRRVLADAAAGSAATLRHLRVRAERLESGPGAPARLAIATGEAPPIAADAVVIATGNEPPPIPPFLDWMRGDPRLVADPWTPTALHGIGDGGTVAILGTGLTAIDLAATLVRSRPATHVAMLSRRGDLPRDHEDPWRPKPAEPAFSVEEFAGFGDPFTEARDRLAGYPDGWRLGLDSLRPIHAPLWLSMDDARRRRFVGEWRHAWEIHRSRVAAEVLRDVHAWAAAGRLEVRAAPVVQVGDDAGRLRIEAPGGLALVVDAILLATGPDERARANPFLAAGLRDGLLREGPLGLGIDADPSTLRVLDGTGQAARPVWALGPVLKGVLWETIAIPEIRVQAARVAAELLGALGAVA